MKKHRLPALMLAALLAASCMAGCSSSESTASSSSLAPSSSGSAAAPEASAPAAAEEPAVLRAMMSRNAAVLVAYSENEAVKELEKRTNTKLDIIEVDSGSWTEKLNLAFASDDLPDIFMKCGIPNSTLLANAQQGKLIALNDLIEESAPTIKALLEKNPDAKNVCTLPNGSIITVPTESLRIYEDTPVCPGNMILVNTDWLNTLGLPMPEDTESFYQMLKSFKEQDPNQNGQADEIPLLPLYGMSNIKELYMLFGIMLGTNNVFVDDSGTVIFSPFDPRFRDATEYLHRLYSEELLDRDVFTQNQQQVVAKGNGETELVGVTVCSAAFLGVGEQRAEHFESTPVLKAPDGSRVWSRREPFTPGSFAITSKCQDPHAAIRLADYLLTPEGAELVWMGIEGSSYEFVDGGKWNWILKEGETATELRARATLQPGGGTLGFPLRWLDINDPVESRANLTRGTMASTPELLRTAYPSLFLEADKEKELTTIAADINPYIEQMIAKFVTGETPINDAEWESFTATAEKMRANDMIAIMQEAYDQYIGN